MILQTANIVGGFILGASKLKELGAKEHIEKGESHLAPFRSMIGLVILILGVLGLVDRLGIVNIMVYQLGSSYPQVIPAILMGLLLSSHRFERFPGFHGLIEKMRPHEAWIGVYGILAGLVSFFFGCPVCMY